MASNQPKQYQHATGRYCWNCTIPSTIQNKRSFECPHKFKLTHFHSRPFELHPLFIARIDRLDPGIEKSIFLAQIIPADPGHGYRRGQNVAVVHLFAADFSVCDDAYHGNNNAYYVPHIDRFLRSNEECDNQ